MYKETPDCPAVSARLTAFAEKAFDNGKSYEWADRAGQLAMDTYTACYREKFWLLFDFSS